jgi:5'-nucleotidase
MTPRILITNDDGIDAPGLRHLARAAARQGLDIVIAAPLTEASGTSAAMTAVEKNGKIVVEQRELPGVRNVPAYAVAASPAFIVLLALRGAFGPPPEIVLSGINRGANAGAAVVHSGTVGATLTASHAGLHGLAVSLDVLSPANGTAASGGWMRSGEWVSRLIGRAFMRNRCAPTSNDGYPARRPLQTHPRPHTPAQHHR